MFDGTSKIAYGKKKLEIIIVRSVTERKCFKCLYSHSQSHIVLWSRQTQFRVHAGDLCIADVGSVEEGEQIQKCQYRNEPEVDFAKDTFRLFGIEDLFLLSCRQYRSHHRI